MSRGPGIVQRRLLATLQAEPGRWFTIAELAEVAFPGDHRHLSSVRRALEGLPGLHRAREGQYGVHGYRGFVSLSSNPKAWGVSE
jgi:hypothetical protein